jgi:3-phosphoshikimate 1-carboxyvinyltransferase
MAVVEVPESKSITARALFLAAAARGPMVLRKPLDSAMTPPASPRASPALGYKLDRVRRWDRLVTGRLLATQIMGGKLVR